LEAVQHLERSAGSVAVARRWAADRAAGWGLHGIIGELQVVVSEMVTNAVLHAGTDCTLTLRLDPTVLVVEVADGSPEAPRPESGREHGGRGLRLVAAFSSAWGYEPTMTGKTVWAEIDLAGAGER
jgi:anti-sigma regulatory factor (Ser/Thr protein kinase)